MKITREFKAGVLVVASISLFIWGYSFLKGRDLFADYKTYYVYYPSVEGLTTTAPVTINGLVVGKVNSIQLEPDGRLRVELQVKGDFPVAASSQVNIYEPGLIGGKQIQIVPNLEDNRLAESGMVLKGTIIPGLTDLVAEKLTPLQEKVEKMVVSADVVLRNINEVMDAKTKENLRTSIANLSEALNEFKDISGHVNELMDQNKARVNSSLSHLEKTTANFAKISDSISAAQVGKTLKKAGEVADKLNTLLAGIEAGKGSLGKLAQDPSLVNNLTKTSKELELLLEDLRLNPTRYINVSLFGKKNKPYKSKSTDTIAKP